MELKVEKSRPIDLAGNWIIIRGWGIKDRKFPAYEILLTYNSKNYRLIYPKEYFEKKYHLLVLDQSSNAYHFKFEKDFLDSLDKDFGGLESIMKKIK